MLPVIRCRLLVLTPIDRRLVAGYSAWDAWLVVPSFLSSILASGSYFGWVLKIFASLVSI